MITLTLPNKSIDEKTACEQFENSLSASQIGFKSEDLDDEKQFTFDDQVDEHSIASTLQSLGIELVEDDDDVEYNDVESMIRAVVEGKSADEVYDEMLEKCGKKHKKSKQ